MLRAHWSGRLAFILAAAGSAVGLGNIWKFPYITGTNGGGAFVLIYLLCIAVVGVPIFMAELYIGQKSQANVVESFNVVAEKKTAWRSIGWLGLVSAVLILSFYSVVGGWVLDFLFRSVSGEFLVETESEIQSTLGILFQSPVRQLILHLFFMVLCVLIVFRGVQKGLERWNKILMPGLLILLLLMFVYSIWLDGFSKSLTFLFAPDFSALTPAGVLEAVGHAFFTLSLGMGAIITYGSYLKVSERVVPTALAVAGLDTLVALISGLTIFAVVFSFDMEAKAGPTLMFQTLPVLFAKLPAAYWVSLFFFLLVSFAALTSAVSLFEVVISYWEEAKNTSRARACVLWGVIIYLMGMLSALSTNVLADFKLPIVGLTFFDFFDNLTSQYFLPIGGLLISLFFGWKLSAKACEEITGAKGIWSIGLLWTARIIAPVAVGIVILFKILEDL